MTEYIEREALAEKCHWVIRADGTRVYVCHAEDIETAPAVDVAPVRHGRWKALEGVLEIAVCSVCGESYIVSETEASLELFQVFAELYNYCPNCGAEMDKEEIKNA